MSETCPMHRDDRKSAALAARHLHAEPGAVRIDTFEQGRGLLRHPHLLQAGIGGDQVAVEDPAQVSVFFLDGALHKQRRSAIARFFTPKAIDTRYRAVMERTTDALMAELAQTGRGRLDEMSFRVTVNVAAEIIGLTESDGSGLARRVSKALDSGGGMYRMPKWLRPLGVARAAVHSLRFLIKDVQPAVKARQAARREDVISHMLDEGYSTKAMLIECLTYAAAGMVTTREFIVMAAWHLLESPALHQRFIAAREAEQIAILEEILRLEPIASMLHRRAPEGVENAEAGIVAGTTYGIDVRAANLDEAATGPCPHLLDPDRAQRSPHKGTYLSFGDGSHRCPGAQVAMHESRVFLDRLLRLPDIRLERAPDISWRGDLMSYELRHAVVSCAPTAAR